VGTGPYTLVTERLGPLPIINHVLDRLHVRKLLAARIEGRVPMEDARRLEILVRNILVSREPLYALAEWATRWSPSLLAPPSGLQARLNDDGVGRALDKLFSADRASLQTELVAQAVKEFDLDLGELHNDTTTVTFRGDYETADGRTVRGRRTLVITFGHNKDHRDDLKQLLWSLTVTHDGAVPVHYRIYDGNTNDTPTHLDVWEALQRVTGRPDFLYVADSKLCDGDTLRYLHGKNGRFLTILPRSRREDALFRAWAQDHMPAWAEVAREAPDTPGSPDTWRMTESPIPASDGFRLVWAWSTRMTVEDQAIREDIVHRAIERLEDLERRLQNPRTGYRDHGAVAQAAEKAIGEKAARWLEYEVRTENVPSFRQTSRGRPTHTTRYVRTSKTRFHVAWTPKKEAILYDAKTDGMFPLLTNTSLPLKALLEAYRYQPRLEKRFEQMKTVYAVAPMFLKKISRIESLLFLYFLVLIVQALVERELRSAMRARRIPSLPMYPEDRPCKAPTADRVFALFEDAQLHRLFQDSKVVQVFRPELSRDQKQILSLLGVPITAYTGVA